MGDDPPPVKCPKGRKEINVNVYGAGLGFSIHTYRWFNPGHTVNTISDVINAGEADIAKCEKTYGKGCCCIRRLTIAGHGDIRGGVIGLGATTKELEVFAIERRNKSFDNEYAYTGWKPSAKMITASNAHLLRPLRKHMCPHGSTRLHVCHSGDGSLLRGISNALNSAVFGSSGLYLHVLTYAYSDGHTVSIGPGRDEPFHHSPTPSNPFTWIGSIFTPDDDG